MGKATPRKEIHSGILDNAEDWSLMVDDIENMMVFPGFIAETSLRPDIVIWSRTMQQVIIIELTVPAETNFENANYRKKTKYSDLVDQCQLNGWKVHLFPIEMGSRGFAYGSLHKCLKEIGMDKKRSRIIVQKMSKMALRCSYAIYLSRKKIDFQKWQMKEPQHLENASDTTIESGESRKKGKEVNSPSAESNSKCKKISNKKEKKTVSKKSKDNYPKNARNITTTNQVDKHSDPGVDIQKVNSARSKAHVKTRVVKALSNNKTTDVNNNIPNVANHICGLFNMGNTCFINSCIQLIYHLNFKDIFENTQMLPRGVRDTSGVRGVSDALRRLFNLMQTANKTKPLNFLEIVRTKLPQFSNGEQHDAHEFLMSLLNILQQENVSFTPTLSENLYCENVDAQAFLMESLLTNNSKWYKDFLVVEQYSVSCCQCGSSSTQFQASCCLSIKVTSTEMSLENIFKQTTNDTTVSMCLSCAGPKQKHISHKIILTSKYILIHLDRFTVCNGMPMKNTTLVHPSPVKININNGVLQYGVTGVIAHYGTMTSGHYTYFRNNESSWIEISDLSISRGTSPKNGYVMLLELESNLG